MLNSNANESNFNSVLSNLIPGIGIEAEQVSIGWILKNVRFAILRDFSFMSPSATRGDFSRHRRK